MYWVNSRQIGKKKRFWGGKAWAHLRTAWKYVRLVLFFVKLRGMRAQYTRTQPVPWVRAVVCAESNE